MTSHILVIAEKPSVARSIAGVIGANKKQDGYMEGNGYLVSWCIGHLVSLADAGTYDPRYKKWAYDDPADFAAGMAVHHPGREEKAV